MDCNARLGDPEADFKRAAKAYYQRVQEAEWQLEPTGRHLRELKPTPGKWWHVAHGKRETCREVTRLRLGWNMLADTQRRLGKGTGKCAYCGHHTEDREHFLLHCLEWLPQRDELVVALVDGGVKPPEKSGRLVEVEVRAGGEWVTKRRYVTGAALTTKLLLGGEKLPCKQQDEVRRATHRFVEKTKRFHKGPPTKTRKVHMQELVRAATELSKVRIHKRAKTKKHNRFLNELRLAVKDRSRQKEKP